MQTTLSIDEDILAAAEELADFHQMSLGKVISSLARQSLNSDGPPRVIRDGICVQRSHQDKNQARI